MNAKAPSWLIPTAVVTYVSLSSVFVGPEAQGGAATRSTSLILFLVAVPVALALCLRWLHRTAESNGLATSLASVRTTAIGAALVAAAWAGAETSVALTAFKSCGLGLTVVGTFWAIADLSGPPGVLRGHPAARSRDGVWFSLVLWSTVVFVLSLRWFAPTSFPLDPVTLELAQLFASLGSLLTLGALLFRTRWLRGLEVGVRDRVEAALSVAFAGVIVGATAGFIDWGRPLEVASLTLGVVTVIVSFCVAAPRPVAISRGVRGVAVLLLLATPTLLAGVHGVQTGSLSLFSALLLFLLAGVVEGALARRLSRPLSPAETRWLNALDRATEASLHPEPEQALSATLFALRRAEPTSRERPEIFRADPPAVMSVDIAGYRHESKAEFPMGLARLADGEPGGTVRRQTLEAAQVRQPELRPLLSWFQAHRAESVTVLREGSEPIGLLALPRGRRSRVLTLEEVERLAALAARLSGLLAVNSALRRARLREEEHIEAVNVAQERAGRLADRLAERQSRDRKEAEERVAVLRRTAHSPAAQVTLQALEATRSEPALCLKTPLGVDPLPWAAHAHLAHFDDARPLVVVDAVHEAARHFDDWTPDNELSPPRRAAEGTLVLVDVDSLAPEDQSTLAKMLDERPPGFVVAAGARVDDLLDCWEGLLTDAARVTLPSLQERAEDLQALIMDELTRLGRRRTGAAIGIDRSALYELIDHSYPGNESELRGLLHALVAEVQGERIGLDAVERRLPPKEPGDHERSSGTGRRRSRLAPRARRP